MHTRSRGFTIIELVVVLVIIGILGTLVAFTYSGVKSRERDAERQTQIDQLQSELEVYYAQHTRYPTLAQMNDTSWRAENMPELRAGMLRDPLWNDDVICSKDGIALLAAEPVEGCFAYRVSGTEGAACDNADVICAHYTLTATLEDGETYLKTGLN